MVIPLLLVDELVLRWQVAILVVVIAGWWASGQI